MHLRHRFALASLLAAAVLATVGGCSPSAGSGPGGTPTLDAQVASTLDTALSAVKTLPGVATATTRIGLSQRYSDSRGHDVTPSGLDAWNDAQLNPGKSASGAPGGKPVPSRRPAAPAGSTESHSFSASFAVGMTAGATPAEVGAVPTTMAKNLAWTGVSLTLTTPAGPGRLATTTTYSGTFDQSIPIETSSAVAAGAEAIARFPGLTSVEASIPPTMRVDYGQLNLGGTLDEAAQTRLRAVVAGTIFKGTTTHGALPNGARP